MISRYAPVVVDLDLPGEVTILNATATKVTIKFNPSRAGAPVGVIRKIYDSTGKEVLSFGGSIDQ